jgi:hypothetical protein
MDGPVGVADEGVLLQAGGVDGAGQAGRVGGALAGPGGALHEGFELRARHLLNHALAHPLQLGRDARRGDQDAAQR